MKDAESFIPSINNTVRQGGQPDIVFRRFQNENIPRIVGNEARFSTKKVRIINVPYIRGDKSECPRQNACGAAFLADAVC